MANHWDELLDDVDIRPVETNSVRGQHGYQRAIARWVLNRLLSWADVEGAAGPIGSRGALAVVKRS